MLPRLYWYLDPLSPHQLKTVVKVGTPLTKLFGSAQCEATLQEVNNKGTSKNKGTE